MIASTMLLRKGLAGTRQGPRRKVARCSRSSETKTREHHELDTQDAQDAQGRNFESILGMPRSQIYIDNFMERPLRTSMANSTQSRDLYGSYYLLYTASRAPYSFDIGLNSLTTP
jgi:hypothetical protein